MIITKTPYRISFFGGGSDYPIWYKKFGGSVLSTTIDKYVYISCRELPPFFDHKYRIVWSKIENVKKIDEIIDKPVEPEFDYGYIFYKIGDKEHPDGIKDGMIADVINLNNYNRKLILIFLNIFIYIK